MPRAIKVEQEWVVLEAIALRMGTDLSQLTPKQRREKNRMIRKMLRDWHVRKKDFVGKRDIRYYRIDVENFFRDQRETAAA
jgi:hypothetical protein